MTDTELLWSIIDSKGIKRLAVAEAIGMSYQGFLNKMQHKRDFTASEIQRLCDFLNITSLEEKEKIFFAGNVDGKSTE
jgi:DNA-binding Xre family transcriptional regulator